MQSIEELLSKVGLSKNAATVYLHLLRTGTRPGPSIHTETGMDKSSCYRALRELEDQHLVSVIGETRNQQFTAANPRILTEILATKESQLQNTKRELGSFIKSMDDYFVQSYKSTNVSVYEGPNGYKAYMETKLDRGTDMIRDLSNLPSITKYTDDYYGYMKDFVPRRVKLKIPSRILIEKTAPTDELDVCRPDILKEVRRMPYDLKHDAYLSVFGKHTGFYSRKANHFLGIVIHDPMITNLVKSMFDIFWNMSEPVLKPTQKGNI